MATAPSAGDQRPSTNIGTTKTVDASLWWDSFNVLLSELENLSLSSSVLPPSLEKKLKDNHAWFVETITLFKPPSQKSREALDSQQVRVGSHQLNIRPELKDTAVKLSSILNLDEVQSYILVQRSIDRRSDAFDGVVDELLHMVMLQYYLERQCLLKCTRQILTHALYVGRSSKEGCVVKEEAEKLISDGLESRLLSILQDLLSSDYPEHMDVALYTLWAEETLVEEIVILDILFLTYYESFCTCNGKQWKKLCLLYEGIISGSYNFEKLAISAEAVSSIYHVKVQLLLILIESLDLENLLQMIHDQIPFRQGRISFSLADIQEIDAMISSFNVFERKEAGPLVLAWAVFLCLVTSLPGKEENSLLMDIDHVGYVRQAFEAASLSYFLEILERDILKDLDGPVAGYRSVLRTFISAFIASYEISLQLEDSNLKLILEILCKIYRGEESLCIQFWDRDSFIDGPIRCLLCNLEGEFPFRTVELVSLLSAVSEGAWPAECVFNFLDKTVGLSSLLKMGGNSMVDDSSQLVETLEELHVPGVEGLVIPSRTRGHVLRMVDSQTALVRWEHAQSGVLVLLLCLARDLYSESREEILHILDLLSRLVTYNTGVCYSLMEAFSPLRDDISLNGQLIGCGCVDVVEIICTLIKGVPPSVNGAVVMSMGVNILAKMLKCSPSRVATMTLQTNVFDVALRTNPFDVGSNGLSSGSWLLSGRLSKMLSIDYEQNDCSLTLSVLEFTIQLLETGCENDVVLALVVFSLQYVLVNHEFWKFKLKHARWKVTLKVLEVVQKCTISFSHRQKIGEVIKEILFCDSSIHNALFRIICTTPQHLEGLYVNRLYELSDIEGLQLAISSGLDLLYTMLSEIMEDQSILSVLLQAVLSSLTKPIPVVAAVISLTSCFQNPNIQLGAVRLLSKLFFVADYSQSYVFGNASFGLDEKQIRWFRHAIDSMLHQQIPWNDDLIIATFNMLTSAAHYQPAFLVAVFTPKESFLNADLKQLSSDGVNSLSGYKEPSLTDGISLYIKQSDDLINSKPRVLLSALKFVKALWLGASEFTEILEQLKKSDNFWVKLSDSVMLSSSMGDNQSENVSGTELQNLASRYFCQSSVLEIMAREMFLQKKYLQARLLVKQSSQLSSGEAKDLHSSEITNHKNLQIVLDILSSWWKKSLLSNMIKAYAMCGYDERKFFGAKDAAGLFSVHVMGKLLSGNPGSLSMSLTENMLLLFQKLSKLPAFSELLAQYRDRGYREGKELQSLVISDLFYHLQGELEGRQIDHRSFKELSQYLREFNFLSAYQHASPENFSVHAKDVYFYDTARLRADMGLDLWDLSDWRSSMAVAETLLHRVEDVNSMVMLSGSKLSALKALINMLSMCEEDSIGINATTSVKIPEQLSLSLIEPVCQYFHASLELLGPCSGVSKELLDILAARAELLLHFIKTNSKNLSSSARICTLKTSAYGLKVLSGFKSSLVSAKTTIEFLLVVILFSVDFCWENSHSSAMTMTLSAEACIEACNVRLGILPLLFSFIELPDFCWLVLANIDLILKGFSTPATWLPLVQKHLKLQHVVQMLQDENCSGTLSIILKFLLTLAHVREGAEMLLNSGFPASLKVLFGRLSNRRPSLVVPNENIVSSAFCKTENPQHIWGLSLAVIIEIVHSLGDSSGDFVEYVMAYLFLENSHLISYYLSLPDFPSDDHDKKRARAMKAHTSLNALKDTEFTLMMICVLSRHQNSWVKILKEMDSQLRERCIHLLAFIGHGSQRSGESPSRVAPILCHPVLKEEVEWYKKPSAINSKNGWFALAPLGCGLNPKFSSLSSITTALVIRDQSSGNASCTQPTHFSDATAIEMYKIAFLVLKFLCLQAEAAARRAEEMGFVDLSHFPELPMPDILHGLQDQGIAIVTELCEANKSKQVASEVRGVCLLLLQVTIMSLHLELCVIRICGMRPVLGRVEDFSKEIRLLLKATEGHAFIKESMKSLKQIVSFVYPELLRTEALI